MEGCQPSLRLCIARLGAIRRSESPGPLQSCSARLRGHRRLGSECSGPPEGRGHRDGIPGQQDCELRPPIPRLRRRSGSVEAGCAKPRPRRCAARSAPTSRGQTALAISEARDGMGNAISIEARCPASAEAPAPVRESAHSGLTRRVAPPILPPVHARGFVATGNRLAWLAPRRRRQAESPAVKTTFLRKKHNGQTQYPSVHIRWG